MKISCPSCSAKYSIADEKVQDRLAKIRCRKCGTTIVIDGKVSPASVYAADGGDSSVDAGAASADAEQSSGTPDSSAEYTVDFGDNDQRPMTLDQIVAAYNSGTVTADTYLWAEGYADWKPLGEVTEVVAALHAAAGAPAAPAAETPWQAPKAAPAPAVTQGRDLFGGYESAGSEDDLATSTGGPAHPVAAPFGGAGAATGARNESSVLFSLSALTSASGSSRPSGPPSSAATSEDSGLIDLKALTSAAEAHPATSPLSAPPGHGAGPLGGAPLGAGPLGGAPFGAPAPFGGGSPYGGMGVAPTLDLSIPQQQGKNRTGLFIAGGIVVAAVAVTLILQLTGKSETPAPVIVTTSATTTPLPAPTPTPAPTAAAAPTTDAKPPATGNAPEEAAPGATTAPKTGYKRPTTSTKKPAATSGGTDSPKPPAAEKPAPKPSNKCGCKPGDLSCAMRCAAGG